MRIEKVSSLQLIKRKACYNANYIFDPDSGLKVKTRGGVAAGLNLCLAWWIHIIDILAIGY